MVFLLDEQLSFPAVEFAESDGLLAVGGDLSEKRLLEAYRSGIFPWDDEPLLWFSPDPRMVLDLEAYKPSKSLYRKIKKNTFEIRFDSAFEQVIENCSSARSETWISNGFKEAYTKLHQKGYAHSVECWQEGRLVGGLYGLSLGSAFFGESMFHLVSDASKVAFYHLVQQLRSWNFSLLDCQVNNSHLLSLGAEDIPREAYLLQLKLALKNETRLGAWAKAL
jgi:leucyl/phenylalanyl-tRNA---protein transferase